jgi:hypothetical protein
MSDLTEVGGELSIFANSILADLSGLSALASAGDLLHLQGNDVLDNLDGLSALTTVGGAFSVYFHLVLPDCEVCELLDQLTTGPTSILVWDNLDDTCTPVPENCP